MGGNKMAKRGLGNGLDTMLGVNTTQSRKSKSANQSEKVETKEVIKEVVKEVKGIPKVPEKKTILEVFPVDTIENFTYFRLAYREKTYQ